MLHYADGTRDNARLVLAILPANVTLDRCDDSQYLAYAGGFILL